MKRLWKGVPQASARGLRMLACGMGALLLAAASANAPNDGAVVSLSVEPTSGQAHIIIGVDGVVSVHDFVLHDPERIVVDISGATLGLRRSGYDRIARGGILDVRYAQNQPSVVRVVLTLAGPKAYKVSQNKGEIRVSVDGGSDFTAWRTGRGIGASTRTASAQGAAEHALAKARLSVDSPPPAFAVPASAPATVSLVSVDPAPIQEMPEPIIRRSQQQQPRITIAWENANIRDVLAAFAAFSGRTIIPARGVDAQVTAEIIDKPWDVAMRALLNAYGFDAVEDQNGIIIVNTFEALVQRPRLEPLTTRTIRFNYSKSILVAEALRSRLSKDCGPTPAAGPPGTPAAPVPLVCPTRGSVTADSLSNSLSVTDVPSNMEDMIAYARTLDVRQPQVNIKAKIILVDRTSLEGLGLKYDLGTQNQHFNTLVARVDSTGQLESGTSIFLGGNTLAGIANAAQQVPNAALRLVYTAALGAFDFTTFLEALQETNLLDIQAEPSVTTLNYRKAVLSAGTQVPIRIIEPQTGGNAAGQFPRITVSMRQTGVVLEVTPFITNNRQIQMKVHAENSDVQFQGGDVGAVFPTQSLDNDLLVADGETAVMGGLTQSSVRLTKTGIPLLVDLPLIGRLFGVTNRQETKRDLLILITPHIVDEGDTSMQPRRNP